MYANMKWIPHKWKDRLPRAHLDSEVMKRHFPSPSIILAIYLSLFVLLFLNRTSVQNYDREDKRRQTQWRRMDAEGLRACGHARAYDCMAAAYCVHMIKGFAISLCVDRHRLSWNGATDCDVMKTKHQTSFNLSGATSPLFYWKNSWRMSVSGLTVCRHRCPHQLLVYWTSEGMNKKNGSFGIVEWTYLAECIWKHRLSRYWLAALILMLHHTPRQLQITQTPV